MRRNSKNVRWSTALPSPEDQYAIKRQALIREAGRAFSRRGFHNTSMDDVAKVLNVTKPALYYYIPTKQTILYECHAYALDLGDAARDKAFAASEEPLERLRLLLLNFVEMLTSSFGSYAVLAEPISSLEPAFREKILVRMRTYDRMCRSLVEQAIAAGTLPPCDSGLAIAFVMGAINNITRWYSPEGRCSGREVAEAFVAFIMQGLRGAPPAVAAPAPAEAEAPSPVPARAPRKRKAPVVPIETP